MCSHLCCRLTFLLSSSKSFQEIKHMGYTLLSNNYSCSPTTSQLYSSRFVMQLFESMFNLYHNIFAARLRMFVICERNDEHMSTLSKHELECSMWSDIFDLGWKHSCNIWSNRWNINVSQMSSDLCCKLTILFKQLKELSKKYNFLLQKWGITTCKYKHPSTVS